MSKIRSRARGLLRYLTGVLVSLASVGWSMALAAIATRTVLQEGWFRLAVYFGTAAALVLAAELFLRAWRWWRPAPPATRLSAREFAAGVSLVEALAVVKAFIDDDPCQLSPSGLCQTHWSEMLDGSGCAVPKARALLSTFEPERERS